MDNKYGTEVVHYLVTKMNEVNYAMNQTSNELQVLAMYYLTGSYLRPLQPVMINKTIR